MTIERIGMLLSCSMSASIPSSPLSAFRSQPACLPLQPPDDGCSSSEQEIDRHDRKESPAHHERIVLHPAGLRPAADSEPGLERVGHPVDEPVHDVLIEDRRDPGGPDRRVPRAVDGAVHDRRVEIPEKPAAPLADAP